MYRTQKSSLSHKFAVVIREMRHFNYSMITMPAPLLIAFQCDAKHKLNCVNYLYSETMHPPPTSQIYCPWFCTTQTINFATSPHCVGNSRQLTKLKQPCPLIIYLGSFELFSVWAVSFEQNIRAGQHFQFVDHKKRLMNWKIYRIINTFFTIFGPWSIPPIYVLCFLTEPFPRRSWLLKAQYYFSVIKIKFFKFVLFNFFQFQAF